MINNYFSRKKLPKELRDNLRIDSKMTHYPNNPHSKYRNWNWCRDEFAPPLIMGDLKTYINFPNKYRNDFLKSLKLYNKFCHHLIKQIPKIKDFSLEEKLSSLLILYFLFQSAMDLHYSYYDNQLDLEESRKSPLGWHYLRMKKIIANLAEKIKVNNLNEWVEETTLHLLDKKGKSIINKIEHLLTKKTLDKLIDSYNAMQMYIKLQQEEEFLFFGKNQGGIIYKTGYAILNNLKESILQADDFLIKDKKKLLNFLNSEPAFGTRMLLKNLDSLFDKQIVIAVKKEINNWANENISKL